MGKLPQKGKISMVVKDASLILYGFYLLMSIENG